MPFLFEGVIPAAWTPTDSDGRLLKHAFQRNLRFMAGAGVDALLVLGSTGEFVHFTPDQRKEVVEAAIEAAGSTPVLVNVSDVNPRVVAGLARHAKASGAVGVSLLPPWFFPLSDEDLTSFFVTAAEGAGLPLVLYNFQAMTGKRLTPEIVRAVASQVQIGGLKHSAGDFQEHNPLVELGREFNFNVLTGWDTHIAEAMAVGAKGCIGGLGNLVPELMKKIQGLVASGRAEEVLEPARQMKRIGEIVGSLEFPLNVGAAMEARGLEVGELKSTVSPGTRARYNALRDAMRNLLAELGIATVNR